MFDPIAPQAFESSPAGGRFDSSLVLAPPPEKVRSAARKLGLNLNVTAKADGTISMAAHDLTWETVLETAVGEMTVREAMAHPEFLLTRKLRCEAPFRDSSSQAAFLSRGSDGRPFVVDSGSSTTHWLSDEDWKPKLTTTQTEQGDSPEPLFDFTVYRAGRFLDKPPPVQKWVLVKFIPAGIVGLVIALGGTGKSGYLIQVAVSVVTGLPLAGVWEVGTTGSVLMISAEDDEDQLHRRVDCVINQLGADATPEVIARLREKLIVVPRVGENNLLTSTDPDTREVGMTHLLNRLIAAAKQISELTLIIVDPASRFRGGNENAAEDVTRFVEALEKLARATGATVLVAHHANKGAYQATEQNQSASRGSSALTDGARWQLNLMTFSEKEAQKYGVPVEDKGFYLTAAITKNNYSAPQPPVILKRGEGGYLFRADLVSTKVVRGNTLSNQIMALVASELKDGRTHSKSAFANQFGGKDGVFKVGNNTVRDALADQIKAGRLRVDGGKLALSQRATLPMVRGANS